LVTGNSVTFSTARAEAIAGDIGMPSALIRRLDVVPSYYLRYFYDHDAILEERRTEPSRAAKVAQIEERLLAMYASGRCAPRPSRPAGSSPRTRRIFPGR
jgi:hypothetical protein